MAQIIWDKEYEFGVEGIDNQHKHLCELFNAINEKMERGKGVEVYAQAVDAMINYAHTHFKVEEDLMTKANFVGLTEHLAEHAMFFKQAEDFQLKSDKTREVYETVKLVNFLWEWFLHHIQNVDRKYLPILK